MKPEQLKVIAEGMGYETFSISENYVTVWNGKDIYTRKWYKPHTTNNDQMVEIIERHIIQLEQLDFGIWKALISLEPQSHLGKTINEAVCSAAYEYFKNK